MKLALLFFKWLLFIFASILASIIVYETINITSGIVTHELKISIMLLAWVGWGLVSFFISKSETIEQDPTLDVSRLHQIIHQILYFLLHIAVFAVTVIFVFYWYDSTKITPSYSASPISLPPPVSSEGFGQPKKFTPDMYHP